MTSRHPPRPDEPDFRTLFEQAPDLYVVIDPDPPRYTIVAASDAYTHATGTNRDAIVGRSLFDVFPEDPGDPDATGHRNMVASVERVIRDRAPETMAIQKHGLRRADGVFEERWWLPSNAPVFGSDGELIYILHRVADVTELVRLEQSSAQHQRLNAEVQRTVAAELADRAHELQEINRQLRMANAEIGHLLTHTRKLAELKSKFFASVSHELRTPLSLIIGPAQRLLDSSETAEPARRDLGVIVRNARALDRQLDDLLDAADLDAGRITLTYSKTDIARLLRFVVSHFEVPAAEASIELVVEAPDALWIEIDTDKVRRILFSLLSNALKLTPDAGRVRATLREHPSHVVLEITDGGPARRLGATGIGLAIAHDFLELHGGSIAVAEAPDGGALVTVELPRTAPADAAVQPAVELPSHAQLATDEVERRASVDTVVGPPDGALVLVVEDNRDMNRFICENLVATYRVAPAFDAKQGLRRALELAPDLIVSDLLMPEMTGEELVHEIRSHHRLDRVPIVLVTAKGDEELRVRMLREGAQDYVTKPFAGDELHARIANLIAVERALEMQARLASLVELAPDGIFVADHTGRFIEANPAGCRMLGYSREELLRLTIHDLVGPANITRLEAAMARVKSGEDHLGEWALLRKDGTPVPVETNAKILPDGRWQGLVRDISERKRAAFEQKLLLDVGVVLASTLERVEILERLADLVIRSVCDCCMVHLVQHGQLQRLKVAHRDPAMAARAQALENVPFDPAQSDMIMSTIAAARPMLIREVTPEYVAAVAQNEDHLRALRGLGPTSVMWLPLVAHGRTLGTLSFISTTDHRFDARDLEVAQELAHRAALAIENARLYHEAQTAIQARDEVLSVVAHDLRGPLNTILLLAEGLAQSEHEPDHRPRNAGDVIARATKRMDRLIQDLLDVARLQERRMVVTRERVRVGDLIREVEESQREPLSRASLTVTVEVPADLPDVWVDRDRVVQVLDNVIGNAIKFTRRGGRVTIGAARRRAEVLVWVRDTGKGIHADDMPHLFDRFWQAHRDDRRGAGLGLAIAKGVIEAHGGRIWAESVLGAGTTIYFTLPTTRPEAASASRRR